MRVLLVEDDPRIARDVAAALAVGGYVVEHERDGEEAWFKGDTEEYDAVVLDLGLPGMDGLSVLKRWRANGRRFPILVLTARDAIPDRVRGLDLGADDYIVKPIDLHELSARLRALVRRAHGHPTEQLRARGIVLEPASRTVFCNGSAVALSTREFDLLHALMLNAGRVLSREQLEQCLYTWGQEVGSNAVEVHIHHLRAKLGSDLILTVRGVGYMLPRDNAEAP